MTAPSTYSTIEWIILCGCTTTCTRSTSTPNSHFASITSNPLLTIVEESIVIFCPIDQFGCFSASSTRISSSSSSFLPLNGPPEAVRRILWTALGSFPCKDWKIALCSLSTGRIDTFFSFASGMMICPAVTRVSLLASAISLPALIASIVGRIPIIPTIAVTSISASSRVDTLRSPSMPDTTCVSVSAIRTLSSRAFSSDHTAASFGANSLICFSRRAILFPAASPQTLISPFSLATSRVWVPIEPVEPKIAIFFIYTSLYYIYGNPLIVLSILRSKSPNNK